MRDTLKEKAEKFFSYLRENKAPIYKSELSSIGFDGNSADKWIELIQYIQSESKLKINRARRYVTIELEEN